VAIYDQGRVALFGNQVLDPVVLGVHVATTGPVTSLGPTRPWQPNTWYNKGDTITPQNVDADTTVLPQVWMVCLEPGYSGDTQPTWPAQSGVPFHEGDFGQPPPEPPPPEPEPDPPDPFPLDPGPGNTFTDAAVETLVLTAAVDATVSTAGGGPTSATIAETA